MSLLTSKIFKVRNYHQARRYLGRKNKVPSADEGVMHAEPIKHIIFENKQSPPSVEEVRYPVVSIGGETTHILR